MPGNLPPLRSQNNMIDPRYSPVAPTVARLVPMSSHEGSDLRPACAFHQRDQLALLSSILEELRTLNNIFAQEKSRDGLSQAHKTSRVSEWLQDTYEKTKSSDVQTVWLYLWKYNLHAYKNQGLRERDSRKSLVPSPATPKAMDGHWELVPSKENLAN